MDGSIKTIYETILNSKASSNTPSIFQALMIGPVTKEDDIPIHSFEADRSAMYTDKINGHFIWDVDPNMCDADYECRNNLKDYQTLCQPLRRSHRPDDPNSPWIGLRPIKNKPLPIYDRASQILRSEGLLSTEPKTEIPVPSVPSLPPPIPCYIASNYDQDFPPLEPSANLEKNRFSRPFVQTTKRINRVAHHVSQHDHRFQNLDAVFRDMFTDLQSKIAKLDADLHRYIHHGYFGPKFDKKEKEIRRLKEQLDHMNRDHSNNTTPLYVPKPYPYTQSLIFPTSPPYSLSTRPPDSSHYFKSTGELFRKYPPLSSPPKKPTRKSSTSQKNKQSMPDHYKPVLYTSRHTPSFSETESEAVFNDSSHSSWDSTYVTPSYQLVSDTVADLTQEDNIPGRAQSTRPTNGPWFNLDDSSLTSWRNKISEMSAWLDLQMAISE
ncbi:hypothetical protein Q3G72_010945 [Acer saccharum]|nr:hypothetical protein Q3G72_010945 [Acer saccharum]